MTESIRIISISDNRAHANRRRGKREALIQIIVSDGSGITDICFPPHQAKLICDETRKAANRAKRNGPDLWKDIELENYEDSQ